MRALDGLIFLVAAASLGSSDEHRAFDAGRCMVREGMPDDLCTPGSVNVSDPRLLCSTPAGDRRSVGEGARRRVFLAYGLAYPPSPGEFELDHLVPLCLGGDNTVANLWPEPATPLPGYHEKDRLEAQACRDVCEGRRGLEASQVEVARDWREFYEALRKNGELR